MIEYISIFQMSTLIDSHILEETRILRHGIKIMSRITEEHFLIKIIEIMLYFASGSAFLLPNSKKWSMNADNLVGGLKDQMLLVE